MNKILVIAPHPDDETLGCGGTLLKHFTSGDELYWLIITTVTIDMWNQNKINRRLKEIKKVSQNYSFKKVFHLNNPTTELDIIPMKNLISEVSQIVQEIEPNILYIPFRGDTHSDHKIVFDISLACTKWFRYPSVKKIMVYETISETEFGTYPDKLVFQPNVFVNIGPYIDKKIEIMNIYESEMGEIPFPRSEKAIRALATYRGVTSGFDSAEAFMLIKEINQ